MEPVVTLVTSNVEPAPLRGGGGAGVQLVLGEQRSFITGDTVVSDPMHAESFQCEDADPLRCF
jgi:hypothetical protein